MPAPHAFGGAHLFRTGCVLTPFALQRVVPFQPGLSFLCCGRDTMLRGHVGWPSFISLARDVGSTALGDSVGTQFTLPTLDVCSCYHPQAICPSVRISSNQQESRVQPGLGLFCSKMPGGTGFPPPHRFPSLPCSLETHRPALLQPPGSWAMRLFKLLPKLLPDILGSGSWNERHKTKSFG